ncbi:ARM repeat-containing protein [Auricularia subglabra TFB-10046 SS5]|nr:ARM repeat-containing protein [Auricularia subglabra TFB-10046 SS5]
MQCMTNFLNVPDCPAYLAHICSRMSGQIERLRTLAGYIRILKNNSKTLLRAQPDVAQFVKDSILLAFNDPSPMVRTSAPHNINAYLDTLEPLNWPAVCEKAFIDYPLKLNIDINDNLPLDYVTPKILALAVHPRPTSARIRWQPLTMSLYPHSGQYTSTLFLSTAAFVPTNPRHSSGKSHRLERAGDADKQQRPAGGDDDDDYDEDENYDDDLSTDWNLRNCIEAIEPHLSVLIPYSVSMLNDPKPLLRCIACWMLGRYASWCTHSNAPDHVERYFVPLMEALLRVVLDNNKRVQEAGCSAFATLEENAGALLVLYLEPICATSCFAFEKYQQKNMLILYDAVSTLADAVGSALQNPMYVQILVPPLISRWERLRDDDFDLVPLLECLSCVTIAIGPGFVPYAGPVFDRCHGLISRSLVQFQQYEGNKDAYGEPDKQYIIVALGLLSGLVQGMGTEIARFTHSCHPPFMSMLPFCLRCASPLVGDMAVSCFDLLRSHLPQILPEVVNQLTPEPVFEMVSATNNAASSVGEIALRHGPEFPPWVQSLVPILLNPKCPRSLHRNTAVTIGCIGLVHADVVAPHLEMFAQQWCQAL